jgi:hypothetical protein
MIGINQLHVAGNSLKLVVNVNRNMNLVLPVL